MDRTEKGSFGFTKAAKSVMDCHSRLEAQVEGYFKSARTLKQCYHVIRRKIVVVYSCVRTGDCGGLYKYSREVVYCKEGITLNGLTLFAPNLSWAKKPKISEIHSHIKF